MPFTSAWAELPGMRLWASDGEYCLPTAFTQVIQNIHGTVVEVTPIGAIVSMEFYLRVVRSNLNS
ncbi:hypothetical protein RE428_46520 [Marinobacter nanhaiticus D15-8W]|nr:hypothetical protein RE428_46520 [Marinobacter nanhaiticus D15-8W]